MKDWIGRIALGVSICGLIGIGTVAWLAYQTLEKSLPVLDGERPVEGLIQKVRIERDALGIPTIYAYNPIDQARALGYLHGQERFFQMDLYRRIAAGELAEMFAQGLENDLKIRVHQFRKRSQQIVAGLPEHQRALLEAYSEGVNSGLTQLQSRPFEYHLLQLDPRLWRPEDSILAVTSMAIVLQDSEVLTDRVRGQVANTVPDSIFDYFYKNGSRWESPQDGSIRDVLDPPPPTDWKAITDRWPQDPESEKWMPKPTQYSGQYPRETYTIGSNNWAARPKPGSTNPAAFVANDMHLALRIPNTWYRATLFEQSSSGEPLEVHGATLPGIPGIVVGSNGKIAWGLTNSNADTEDAVILRVDPQNSEHYLTPDGSEPITKEEEIISVNGKPDEVLVVETTRFGPIIGRNASGEKIAFQWAAHKDWAVDLSLSKLARATNTREALKIAQQANCPTLSIVVGDSEGNIGWTLVGSIPKRKGNTLQLKPLASDNPEAEWLGRLEAATYPEIYNPEAGYVTTANARIVGGEALIKMGDSAYTMGSRQWKINDALSQMNEYTETNMVSTIMSIEGQALYPWQALIRWAYSPIRGSLSVDESTLLEQVNAWNGKAEASSVGYRIIRNFRGMMMDRLYGRIFGPVLSSDPSIYYNRGYSRLGIPFEEPFLRILELRPEYLADPYFGNWESEMRYVLGEILLDAQNQAQGLEGYRWGLVNELSMRHPLSSGVPVMGDWLNMPGVELDGDQLVPNATAPSHGPSQRMVVQVGEESSGRFSMPGGQSGHPLSPFYRAGHSGWIAGTETPLRPGSTLHKLTLTPTE